MSGLLWCIVRLIAIFLRQGGALPVKNVGRLSFLLSGHKKTGRSARFFLYW